MRRPANLGTVSPPEKDRDQAPFVLRARLWPDEWDRVCQAARAEGLTVKEWALRVLVGAADPDTHRQLRRLADLLDGDCTLPDGSNADTSWLHAQLGDGGGRE